MIQIELNTMDSGDMLVVMTGGNANPPTVVFNNTQMSLDSGTLSVTFKKMLPATVTSHGPRQGPRTRPSTIDVKTRRRTWIP